MLGSAAPDAALLVEIGRILHEGGAELRGVVTHAGESYHCQGDEAIIAMAEQERAEAVGCAEIAPRGRPAGTGGEHRLDPDGALRPRA